MEELWGDVEVEPMSSPCTSSQMERMASQEACVPEHTEYFVRTPSMEAASAVVKPPPPSPSMQPPPLLKRLVGRVVDAGEQRPNKRSRGASIVNKPPLMRLEYLSGGAESTAQALAATEHRRNQLLRRGVRGKCHAARLLADDPRAAAPLLPLLAVNLQASRVVGLVTSYDAEAGFMVGATWDRDTLEFRDGLRPLATLHERWRGCGKAWAVGADDLYMWTPLYGADVLERITGRVPLSLRASLDGRAACPSTLQDMLDMCNAASFDC